MATFPACVRVSIRAAHETLLGSDANTILPLASRLDISWGAGNTLSLSV
jgi:hypothetical protein